MGNADVTMTSIKPKETKEDQSMADDGSCQIDTTTKATKPSAPKEQPKAEPEPAAAAKPQQSDD